MFYRITTYDYPTERQGEITEWANTKTQQIRSLDGVVGVEVFNASPGEGVIVARYVTEDAFNAASDTIRTVLGELAQFITGPPVTKSGIPFWTTNTNSSAVA